ncbi:hypothetical protein AVEN_37719-1 [Araneus ventricosus]|uniref:Uncharacterized protein n=1 Tax=Araneus ventricosus TaxID=182803 RepID=A0A4Y2BUK5_ARAVE|nr:hypothetical protein AVEN_37719-1 [Araneus ventricosus]
MKTGRHVSRAGTKFGVLIALSGHPPTPPEGDMSHLRSEGNSPHTSNAPALGTVSSPHEAPKVRPWRDSTIVASRGRMPCLVCSHILTHLTSQQKSEKSNTPSANPPQLSRSTVGRTGQVENDEVSESCIRN